MQPTEATTEPEKQSEGGLSEERTTVAETTSEVVEEAASPDQQAEGESPEAEARTGAPDDYEEFKMPEGIDSYPSDQIAILTEAFRDADLTQDQAQAFIDKVLPQMQQQSQAQIDAASKQWREQVLADKDLGGDKLDENLAVAKKALDAFGSEGLKELIETTRLGDHPELIRFLRDVGNAISEDRFVGGREPVGPNPILTGDAMLFKERAAEAFYGKKKK